MIIAVEPVALGVAAVVIFLLLGTFGQTKDCGAVNPRTGRKCKMNTHHKLRDGVNGMWHTDARGGRWRA
jgi:hypothetical protein